MAVVPEPGAMRVVIRSRLPQFDWPALLGAGGTFALVGGGLLIGGQTMAIEAGIGATGLDLLAHYLVGGGRAMPGAAQLSPANLRTARVEIRAGNAGLDRTIAALDQVDGNWGARIQLDSRYLGERLEVRIVDKSGRPLHVEQVNIVADRWASFLAPPPAPPAGPPPVQAVASEISAEVTDVDLPLGVQVAVDPDAVAVVIGIEAYNESIPAVPFAERDARVVREYFERLLGVAPENVIYLTNQHATKGALHTAFEAKVPAFVKPGKSRLYVYFAGHGVPDPESKVPYLVPFDGSPEFAKTSCYSLESLYSSLGQIKAASTIVVLDACFTGQAARSDRAVGLLAQARPLKISPISTALPSGVTVLAAAEGDQVSSGYPVKRHGLFTYFLLKAMRGAAEKPVRLTLGDLYGYLREEVPRSARRLGRSQTPVLLGDTAGEFLYRP